MEAIDASSNTGYKHLQRGIEMAKLMQQAIIRWEGAPTVYARDTRLH